MNINALNSLNINALNILQAGVILGYQFEPRRDFLNNASGESADIEGEENNMSIDEE